MANKKVSQLTLWTPTPSDTGLMVQGGTTKKYNFSNFSIITSGAVAPVTTPAAIGQIYIDTLAAKVYISTWTASSSDWTILN